MAKRTPAGAEEARSVVTSAFTAQGVSTTPAAFFPGGVNIIVWGTFDGTVKVERSFDGGTNWFPVETDLAGTDLSITTPCSLTLDESESAVLYRFNCTAFTSGVINCRASQG